MDLIKEKWTNTISTITLGATKEEGGTRDSTVKVGGETTLPYLFGAYPSIPAVISIRNAYPA